MRPSDVDGGAVRKALSEMNARFYTKDLSRNQAMQEAHGKTYDVGNYHAAVGSYLSAHTKELRLRRPGQRHKVMGELWERLDVTDTAPEPHHVEQVAAPVVSAAVNAHASSLRGGGIGPQYGGDSPLQARMRFHQSWYRARILGVPCGTGPTKNATSHYGNMLTHPDGKRGLNFLTPEAFQAAIGRVAARQGAVEPFRLLHNMLSSQPMCFNLFGPLASDHSVATSALKAMLGEQEVKAVKGLKFEYAPQPPCEYLDDRTAFDAFIEYERLDGTLAFIGIETKLTDSFSEKKYDSPVYRKWTELPDSPWPRQAWSQLSDPAHNQLWRGQMLAVSLLHHARSSYSAGLFAVVYHHTDSDCIGITERYRTLLKPGDSSFLCFTTDQIIEAWRQALPDIHDRWLSEFRLRYVDLDASQSEWLNR